MGKKATIRRCPTCKAVFPTIDALSDHYKKTSHIPPCEPRVFKQNFQSKSPLPAFAEAGTSHSPFLYKCEPCNLVFLFKIPSLLYHFHSEHPLLPLPYCESCKQKFDTSTGLQKHKQTHHGFQAIDSKPTASSVVAQMDASDLNFRRDDDRDTNVNVWGSPKDIKDCVDAQRDPSLAENKPSALLSGNISKPLSSVSELTSSSTSSGSAAGPFSSKLDKATALARAALRNRFAEMGATTGETIPLSISNIWGPPRKANSSVPNLDGPFSVATNLTLNSSNSNEKEVKESKLPLNSLDNITRSLTCPGCQMDFKSFSGFVLHIENRSCLSSMCHEIEDQLNACVTQIFNSLTSSGRDEL